MKRRTAVLIISAISLVIALCIVNVYISLTMPNNKRLNQSIDYKISSELQKALNVMPAPKVGAAGVDGKDGRDGVDGKDGETKMIKEEITIERPAEKAKDGASGNDGKDGKNGRTPVFDIDEETGDVLVKYEGDTLWSLLIEGCKLRKDCEVL